jgi:hypothetical protein
MLEETPLFYAFLALSLKEAEPTALIFLGLLSNHPMYASVQTLPDRRAEPKEYGGSTLPRR